MCSHNGSVFINSCRSAPRNPQSSQPSPNYEQKYLNELCNKATKLTIMTSSNTKKKSDPVLSSFCEFFDSIPEYNDLNHLSNEEFYEKVKVLKEKQKSYSDYVEAKMKCEMNDSDCLKEYGNINLGRKNARKLDKPNMRVFCAPPSTNSNPPSRRSVRIETPSDRLSTNNSPSSYRPKSRLINSSSDLLLHNVWEDELEKTQKLAQSVPNSPRHKNEDSSDGITIPKPFEMTVREEEEKIVDQLMMKKSKDMKKAEKFKAHPVPIESQIPLFDKIMADQELKNYIVRERRKANLMSQMRPFSFTRRDEQIQQLTKGLSKSSPSLFLDDAPMKIKKFRAKPIPRNLFSNYIYQKMYEDEFYRALQKKIRAEEMLRASSLPPSMAKREKYQKTSYDTAFNFVCDNKRSKQKKKNKSRKKRNSASSGTGISTPLSSSELHAVSRSNLAAVLRIESAKRRLELEMCRRLEEIKLKEEMRWREKLMRKKPVWETLRYSHEEDLAMRLQLRRDEERLRSEEHRFRMQSMLGRVNQQPTLFERQSQVKYPQSREDLLKTLCNETKSSSLIRNEAIGEEGSKSDDS